MFELRRRMSRKINVNPGQYKVAGRQRQGEDIVQDAQKAILTRTEAALGRTKTTTRKPRKKR